MKTNTQPTNSQTATNRAAPTPSAATWGRKICKKMYGAEDVTLGGFWSATVAQPTPTHLDGVWSYGTPRLIYLEDGRSRLYFHRYTHPLNYEINAGNHIISAISNDGLGFSIEEGIRIAQETARETFSVYAPEVIRHGDGGYRMYYAAWTRDVPGGIFTATSSDGLTWIKDPEICIELDVPLDIDMVSEPCITELPDGRPRLFYEARDREGDCRILSATGGA